MKLVSKPKLSTITPTLVLFSFWAMLLLSAVLVIFIQLTFSATYRPFIRLTLWGLFLGIGIFLFFLQKRKLLHTKGLPFAGIALVLIIAAHTLFEINRITTKQFVLSNPRISEIGAHFIVSFDDDSEVEELISKGAIGGVYLSQKNIAGKTIPEIKNFVDHLQSLYAPLNRGPLLIVTDQEGGVVARLTPPLSQLPAIGSVVEKNTVHEYASQQAQGLKSIGVNLNLAPVVDLPQADKPEIDLYTKINKRAISSNPDVIISAAQSYIDEYFKIGIIPTIKHFPGLGQINEDTHLFSATTHLSEKEMTSDLSPFLALSSNTQTALMLSHVIWSEKDPTAPVSISKNVVSTYLRGEKHIENVLISDDMTMAPIAYRRGGIGKATVDGLNAGTDLFLIVWDHERYYDAVAFALHALENNKVNTQMLTQSDQRIQSLKREIQ